MRSISSLQAGVAPGTRVPHLVVKLCGCACAVLFGVTWRTGSLTLAGWRLEGLALGCVTEWLFVVSVVSMDITRHADV